MSEVGGETYWNQVVKGCWNSCQAVLNSNEADCACQNRAWQEPSNVDFQIEECSESISTAGMDDVDPFQWQGSSMVVKSRGSESVKKWNWKGIKQC